MTRTAGGIVTLLFTDIVDSVELREKLGDDEAEVLLRTHFRLLRHAVVARGGQEVKNLGDGLMVAFTSALDALGCAVAMQQTVHRHNGRTQADHQLRVRVGLNVGEPIHDEEDYFGTPVNIAKRLCDSAEGGQILASELVRSLVGSRGGYTFRELGPRSLKGISTPLPVCEVCWEPSAGREGGLPLPPLIEASKHAAFVARGRELQLLRQLWERARAGQRQLLLLAGDPGIGKTSLALEFARAAHAEGATVLFGHCDETALVTYQPFVEALRHFVGVCPPDELWEQVSGEGATLVRLVPELAEHLPNLPELATASPEGDRYQLFGAVASFLAAASRSSPLVLILDDLHWADEPTLLLLRHIARSPERSALIILGTYREADIDRSHPLARLLADLRRDRTSERMALQGLAEHDVATLVGEGGGQNAVHALSQAIHKQTEGNPFYIGEIVRHLKETGVIDQHDGQIAPNVSVSELHIPESIKEVIGQRLSRLSEECNSVLTIASVIGREFDLGALERASGLPSERLLEHLDEAVAAHVVVEAPQAEGRFSFSQGLMHETLYDELTTSRRVRFHGQSLQYADSSGVKLAYEVLGGSGPHIVAVGISNCPAVRTRSWATVQHWERMSRQCRVILYDRRGVGFSAAPDRGYGPIGCMEDLRAVLDAAGVDRAVLCGAVDGGSLAIAFAAQYPQRVMGLLLLGTSAKYLSSEDYDLGVDPAIIESFLRTGAVDKGRALSQLLGSRPRQSAAAISDVMKRIPPRVWDKVLGSIVAVDARPLLGNLSVPTLIIHDPGNTYIPVGAAHYLHENIAGSELEITEEYATWPVGEGVYRKIEAFVQEVSTGGDQ